MITLDTNLLLNTNYYILNTKRKNANAYSSIEEYSQAHATKNSPESKATNYKDLDFNELIKALKLHIPTNRLIILNMMSHQELVQLLFLLDKKMLLLGLKFFTKKKLLKLVYDLPKTELLKMLFEVYTKRELLELLPMKEIMKFFDSKKIQHGDILKVLDTLPTHLLAQIMEGITGTPVGNKSHKELLSKLGSMKQEVLVEGLKSLSIKDMIGIAEKILEQDPKLFTEFSKPSLFKPITNWQKIEIIESMNVLDPELIIKMLDKLPNELLAQVVTMLEPDKLGELLQSNFSNLLASLAA